MRYLPSSLGICVASVWSLVGLAGCSNDETPAAATGIRAGALSAAGASAEAPSAQSSASLKQLALGKAHGCSLDSAISGVLCWGDNRKGQTRVPSLRNPSFVAAGGDTSCAIAGGRVQCWGDGANGQLRVPLDVADAQLVAVGATHVCAATRSGVRCWGDDTSGQLRAPALMDVTGLAAGSHHSCALSASGVRCWGDDSKGQLKVPKLTAARSLSAAGDHSCVIDAGQVVCWGEDVPTLLASIPKVSEPKAVATGATHACALDAGGVQCWGDLVAGDLKPRELTLTSQLAVGGGDGWAHACARHLQGVTCWGANNFGQAHYDGAPLHVLHASEARINASAEKVWSIIMDLDKYPEWNPYTIRMQSTLKIGDPMVMTVKMNDLITLEQTEYIRVLEQGHKVCWGINTDTPAFNSGERCQWLEPLPGGGTLWRNEDLIEGTANELVTSLFGNDVQVGFDAVGVALKRRAERD